MKKNDLWSLLVFLIMGAIIIVSALVFISEAFGRAVGLDGNLIIGFQESLPYLFVALLISIVINGILEETCHVIGALIGGYKIKSVNFFGLEFARNKDHKFKFGLSSFNGLTGETKVLPKNDKASLKLYCLLPLFVLCAEVLTLILVIIYSSSVTNTYLEPCFLVVITITLAMIVYQFFPVELDSLNDGYRFVLITSGGGKAQVAFNKMLEIEAEVENGNANWAVPAILPDTLYGAKIYLMNYYREASQGSYEAAEATLKQILEVNQLKEMMIRVHLETIFIKACLNLDEARRYYEEELSNDDKKVLYSSPDLDILRCYLLVSALIEKSDSEMEFAKKRIAKLIEKDKYNKYVTQKALLEKTYELIRKTNLKETI
ncbi:MAG: hypothetical protein LBR37_01530 [Erysipelotrichaceae bacterium]|jgi:hypothetical protein|nr:hypothetical protein [Erysipelotrichaceae bacterium]